MRATIFGSQGFVGGHLASYLRQCGYAVEALQRDADWRNRSLGHVFYCAGVTADFRTRPFETMAAHAGLITRILETAEFDSLLYLSSTRIYRHAASTNETATITVDPGDPDQVYDISKLAGEAICHASHRSHVRVARLSNVVGNDPSAANFLPSLINEANKTGHVHFRSAPESEKDYIAVTDVTAACEAIASRGAETCYNVASGNNLANRTIATALQTALGCSVSFEPAAPLIRFEKIDTTRLQGLYRCRHPDVLAYLFPPALKTH